MQKPSAEFFRRFAKHPQLQETIDRFQKEFDIYRYISDFVPKNITDKDWSRLLQTKNIRGRVRTWTLIALNENRAEIEKAAKEKQKAEYAEYLEKQKAIFDAGGMGYGNEMYRFFLNPEGHMNDLVHKVSDIRLYNSQKFVDRPTLAFDMQFVPNESIISRSRLATNFCVLFSSNYTACKNPFPVWMINCDVDHPHTKRFFEHAGHFRREKHTTFVPPPIYTDNPFSQEENRDKNIVYISRYSKEILDGPLVHDAYILPVTSDYKSESVVGARKFRNAQFMSLPLGKYVNWKTGPMLLPLSRIVSALDIVSSTGGDWYRALHAVVSKRHLMSDEENRANNFLYKQVHKYLARDRQNVINEIRAAYYVRREESNEAVPYTNRSTNT